MTELAKIMGGLWGDLDDDEKAEWKQKSINDFDAGGGKKAAKASKPAKKKAKKAKSEEEDSDSDAPLGAPVLSEDIKSRIKEILEGADLSQLSVKKVRAQLAETYDAKIVSANKEEIKAFINSCVNAA
jgi:hypothetical protein